MRKILKPSFYDEFHCIADLCENHCCKDWRISVDKKSYKLYESLKLTHDETGKRRISWNKNKQSNLDYGQIHLKENGECTFFQDGLCYIHKNYGPETLCYTCYQYPKKSCDMTTHLEISVSLSCPEAARKILLNPEPIEFEFVEAKPDPKLPSYLIVEEQNKFQPDDLYYYYWDLRNFAIDIVQNRSYSIRERMLILGMFVKRISAMSPKQYVAIPESLDEFERMLADEAGLKQRLGKYPLNIFEPTASFLDKLVLGLELDFSRDVVYRKLVVQIASALELTNGNYERTLELYKTAYQKHYKPYFENHEYMLENMLVNEIYMNVFPLYRMDKDLDRNYKWLLTWFYLSEFYLTASAVEKPMSEELVVEVLHGISRAFSHHVNMMDLLLSE